MIHTLDLHFLGEPQCIAAFLVDTGDGLTLIETGPYSTFDYLCDGVERLGYSIDDIRHVLLTHIHLDHAGAAWALAERGANVYVHPFGERHLLDPSRLMDSARRIYQGEMDRLWGDMRAIPRDRLHAVEHGATVAAGDRRWTAWHTPGHAVHHVAWQLERVVFTGDVAGVRIGEGIVVPPCPPPDIDVEVWLESIRFLRALNPDILYLTHFGAVEDVELHLNELEIRLLNWANWMRPYAEQQQSVETVTPAFQQYVDAELARHGVTGELRTRYEYANPSWMSVAGLLRYWGKKLA